MLSLFVVLNKSLRVFLHPRENPLAATHELLGSGSQIYLCGFSAVQRDDWKSIREVESKGL